MPARSPFLCICLLIALLGQPLPAAAKMIIVSSSSSISATLGAPSLATSTLAAALGAEYLELPVVLSADGHLMVFRPLTLEGSTDVEQVFPEKKRDDGSYYLIDFTLDQLRRLRLLQPPIGKIPALGDGIATLPEQLALLRRLETILTRPLGIVLEPRAPWFHHQEGKELSRALLATVQELGYAWPHDKIYLQCYDPEELQFVHRQLFAELPLTLPLIQLIGDNHGNETKHQNSLGNLEPYNYDWLFTNVGLRFVASYAVAVAVPARTIADPSGQTMPLPQGYIDEAHRHGLQVLALAPPPGVTAEDRRAAVEHVLGPGRADGLYSADVVTVRAVLSPPAPIDGQTTTTTLPSDGIAPEPPAGQDDLPPFFKNLNLSRPSTPTNDNDGAQQRVIQ